MSLENLRHAAAQAVSSAAHQQPSPAYGYQRLGQHQKVYLFPSEHDALGWLDQASGYEYAAVFSGTDPRAPIAEDLGQGTSVGHWFLPLALGVPAGALGGYAYRKWQESHPGKYVPWISGEWASIQDPGPPRFMQRGPWIDIVGAAPWQRTHALIQSAAHQVVKVDRQGGGGAAYVWYLDPDGTSGIVPAASYAEGLDLVRNMNVQGGHVALALFDKASHHWPHTPVNWTKSDDPAYEGAIAVQISHYDHGQRVSGDGVGYQGFPWGYEIVGGDPTTSDRWPETRAMIRSAIDATLGDNAIVDQITKFVIGHLAHQGYIDADAIKKFPRPDWDRLRAYLRGAWRASVNVDPLIDTVARSLASFMDHHTYHRNTSVQGYPWHEIVGSEPWESIVGSEPWNTIIGTGPWGTLVGETLSVLRRQAVVAAEEMPGVAIGTLRDGSGKWQLKAFRSVDDADDWYGHSISEPRSFTYAAYFSRGPGGGAILEAEEIGTAGATGTTRKALASVTVAP